jgi:hypothetical protein
MENTIPTIITVPNKNPIFTITRAKVKFELNRCYG